MPEAPVFGSLGGRALVDCTQLESPQQGSPQHGSPQHGSPQQGSPQQGSPQHGSPQHGSPQHESVHPLGSVGGLPPQPAGKVMANMAKLAMSHIQLLFAVMFAPKAVRGP